MELTISKYYGLAILDLILYSFLLFWMGLQVGRARRTYGVKLPSAYENKEQSIFNRYQRAHYNAIETAPIYLITLIVSAVGAPIMSGIAGFIYIIGRYVYCKGYYKDIKSRVTGSMIYCRFFFQVASCQLPDYELLFMRSNPVVSFSW